MSDSTAPHIVGVGAVFIDDIVLPSGQTYMARLGGGVVHAVMGAAIWDEKPGILALVGQGLPNESSARLERHLDTRGLVQLSIPQIRAWQLFEEDGSRRELYRVKETKPFYRVKETKPFISGAQPEHIPESYQKSSGFYLLQDTDGIRAWRKTLDGFILWEPLQQIMSPENASAIRSVLRECHIDVISPNLIEAQGIYGELNPDELVSAMLADGAKCAALRMGAEGSIVGNQQGERHHLDAVTIPYIIDQTGAGNTYCGGLLAGLIQDKPLRAAGAMAAVSASFCLEQVGVLDLSLVKVVDRDVRYQQVFASNVTSR